MTTSFLHGVEVVEISSGARVITAVASSIIGIVGTAPSADPAAFPLDTPVLITSATDAAKLTSGVSGGPGGTLPGAVAGIFDQVKTPIIVVRVDVATGANPAATLAAQMVEIVGDQAAMTGVYALLAAQSELGFKPKILIAPGWTHQELAPDTANPAVQALKVVANRLRGIVVADGPNDTNAHVLASSARIADQRVYLVDPWVKVLDSTGAIVARPPSARVAGVIAATDEEQGYWWSPSNHTIEGILGITRAVEFGLSDPSAASNILNAAGVATIVQRQGFRLWGNRTGAIDSQWVFLSVRRTVDMVEDAVEASYLWALDRPFSAQLLLDITNELNAFLRGLKSQGAILGGKAFLDPDLNTAASLKAGQIYVDFDLEPPAPLERLTFRASRNDTYYADLVDAVANQAAQAAA